MAEGSYLVRPAVLSDTPRLLAISEAVQEKIIRTGSVQQVAGYTPQNVTGCITRGELFVLETANGILGSVFVEPVTPTRFPQIASWNAVPRGCAAWFLYGLVLHPAHQGHGWGHILLDGICFLDILFPPAMLLLDCWAGNHKLRQFYTDAQFNFHGEFSEDDYQVAVFKRQISKSPNQALIGAFS